MLLLIMVLVVQKLACKKLGQQAHQYRQLLDALNDVAHHEINEWMRHEQHLSEPFVARTISQQLPSGTPRPPQARARSCCCVDSACKWALSMTCMVCLACVCAGHFGSSP